MFFQPLAGVPNIHAHFFGQFSETDIASLECFHGSSLFLIQIEKVNLIAGKNSLPDKLPDRGFPLSRQPLQSFGQV